MALLKIVVLILCVSNEIIATKDQSKNGNSDIINVSSTIRSEESTNWSVGTNGTEETSDQILTNKNATTDRNVNTSEIKEQHSSTNSLDLLYAKDSTTDTEVSEMLDIPGQVKYDLAPEHSQAIKDNGPIDTQILLLDHFYHINTEEKKFEESKTGGPLESSGLVPGKMVGLLAGVFLVISIAGYVVLVSWRKYLEKRYGNREMLVDNDFCEKMNDLEHFSI